MAGRTKAVVSSPAMLKISTCSPTDGAHHVRALPARMVSHLSGVVSSPPVCTRHRPFSVSTSEMVPIRIRFVSRRRSSESCVFIGTACHARGAGCMLRALCGVWHKGRYRAERFVSMFVGMASTAKSDCAAGYLLRWSIRMSPTAVMAGSFKPNNWRASYFTVGPRLLTLSRNP